MLRPTHISLLLLLAIALLAGCAGFQQTAKAPHPVAGAWDFGVDMMGNLQEGTLTIVEAQEAHSDTPV